MKRMTMRSMLPITIGLRCQVPLSSHDARMAARSPLAMTAAMTRSSSKSSGPSIDSRCASSVRARLTRLLIVPVGHPQIFAASSYESPEAPIMMSTSRCLGSSLSRASQSSWYSACATWSGLEAPLAAFGEEVVLHDRAQPCQHVRAGRERHYVCACADERVLNEIVGVVAVPAKRNGESAKTGHCSQHGFSDGRLQRSDLFAAWKVRRSRNGARLAIRKD